MSPFVELSPFFRFINFVFELFSVNFASGRERVHKLTLALSSVHGLTGQASNYHTGSSVVMEKRKE